MSRAQSTFFGGGEEGELLLPLDEVLLEADPLADSRNSLLPPFRVWLRVTGRVDPSGLVCDGAFLLGIGKDNEASWSAAAWIHK